MLLRMGAGLVSDGTAIEWCDSTLNLWYGCTKVSPGCANCYIERTPPYRMAGLKFERGAIPLRFFPDRLTQPLRWRKPRRIFVNALSDTFHEDVSFDMIERLWRVMWVCREHTFLLLTKRPDRMRAFMRWLQATGWPSAPLPNVWLGVTTENQRWADQRIPILLDTPAAVRFVSVEPLLGPVNLRDYLSQPSLDPSQFWVICGGESRGPSERQLVERCGCPELMYPRCPDCGGSGWRPKVERLEWVRSLREQCITAGVPYLFKQWGGPRPKSGGRCLDGQDWTQFPGAYSRRAQEVGS